MLDFKSILLMLSLSLIAFAIGYLIAHKFFDGRKENMTKEFRLLIGVRFADIIVTLSIVAQILIYIYRNYL